MFRGNTSRIERCSPGVCWHTAQKHIMPPFVEGLRPKLAGMLQNRGWNCEISEIFRNSKVDCFLTGWRRVCAVVAYSSYFCRANNRIIVSRKYPVNYIAIPKIILPFIFDPLIDFFNSQISLKRINLYIEKFL